LESPTRRRLNRLFALAFAFGGVTTTAQATSGPTALRGTFALLDGSPKVASELRVTPVTGQAATLKIRQFQLDSSTPILQYVVDMQQLMHVVVVRDDFATFEHLHPAFDTTTGTFSQKFTKQPDHRYYVYADSVPKGIGQQVFRFTLPSDGPAMTVGTSLSASAPSVAAGPYVATLSSTTLAAGQPQSLDLVITKRGHPAQDLGTYLGAAAHVVFISTSTLAYVHVHPHVRGSAGEPMSAGMPMDTAEAQAGPNLKMDLPSLPASYYKVWVQFRGANDQLYTAPFTLLVR
jgi:hypothetical protein